MNLADKATKGTAAPMWTVVGDRLVCPRCRSPLKSSGDDWLVCSGIACGLGRFPIVAEVPILLDPDVTQVAPPAPPMPLPPLGLIHRARRAIRPLYVAIATWSVNFPQERHAELVTERVKREPAPRLVLVIGAGFGNPVVERLRRLSGTDVLSLDLRRAEGVDLVADAHAVPFADAAVDIVIIQAVLEHVMDPGRVVREIERVLRPGGLVYSDTPFLQPYHADPTDWQRFTLPGHRLLFRGFEEIDSGPTGGPFMAALWTFHEALGALLAPFPRSSAVIRGLFRIGCSWMKCLDRVAIQRPAGAVAAAGTFFFGARRAQPLPLREIFDPRRWARDDLGN